MKAGILVISHGSREQGWVQLVDEAVAAATAGVAARGMASGDAIGEVSGIASVTIRATASGDAKGTASATSSGTATDATKNLSLQVPVVSAFLEIVPNRLIQDGVDELYRLGVTELFVLPLFVSTGSTHVDDIGQAFGLPPVSEERAGELERFNTYDMLITVGQPIGNDSEIAELLLGNALQLSNAPGQEDVLLLGHGSIEPIFHERWNAELEQLGAYIAAKGGFRSVQHALLLPDQAAGKLQALLNAGEAGASGEAGAGGKAEVVAGAEAGDGAGGKAGTDGEVDSGADVGAIAATEGQERGERRVLVVPVFLSRGFFTSNLIPTRLSGLSYTYDGTAMLPSRHIERWIGRQAEEWLQTLDFQAGG